MANIKISEMTEATVFDDGDYTMIVQANQNKKIARENILGDIEDDISTINTNISSINTNIGDLTQLKTASKDNLVNSINNLCPTILYSNVEGSATNITLSDNIENYDFYEITFSRGGNGYNTVRMSTDFLTNVCLITSFYSGNLYRIYMANISISGTSLTRNYARYFNISDNVGLATGQESSVLIYKVIGYKIGKVEENEI